MFPHWENTFLPLNLLCLWATQSEKKGVSYSTLGWEEHPRTPCFPAHCQQLRESTCHRILSWPQPLDQAELLKLRRTSQETLASLGGWSGLTLWSPKTAVLFPCPLPTWTCSHWWVSLSFLCVCWSPCLCVFLAHEQLSGRPAALSYLNPQGITKHWRWP